MGNFIDIESLNINKIVNLYKIYDIYANYMLTAHKNWVRIEHKVDRGAIDNSTFGRRQPMKEWKGDIAEGLRRARRAAGPEQNMFWTPAR